MKKLYLPRLALLLFFFLPLVLAAQDIEFEDENFKQALLDIGNVDTNADGEISIDEANSYLFPITLNSKSISDLTGIEHFINITQLQCSDNQLKSLDLSNNPLLILLVCSSNQLISLDLSTNTNLVYLECSDNDLTSIQIGTNNEISPLLCNENRLAFSEIYYIKAAYSSFLYSSSKEIFASQTELVNYVLDWSSEAEFDGNATVFTWFNNESGLEVTAEQIEDLGNGQFRFLQTGSYYCEMTNGFFPGTTLTTAVLTIEDGFTVTFEDWDGTVLKTEQVIGGGAATAPADPERTGYTFTGWDVPFNNITADLTVTAQYSINQYTVTFVDWDGSTVLKTESVDYGGAATAPADPVRTGYAFTGWDVPFDNITADLTVTAQYSINQYAVTFVDWDGSTVLKTESVDYGGTATAPADPDRTGYTFSGWDVPFDNITADLTVTAEYTILEYAVTYNNMEDATNAAGNPDTYTIETSILTLDDPAKAGFDFDGWFEDEGLTQEVATIAGGETGDIELWAKWTLATDMDNTAKSSLSIYPIPMNNELSISGYDGQYTSGAIFNLAGKIVKQFKLDGSVITVIVSDLEKGIYLLQLTGKETYTVKVLKR
ncbi:InlB B-repeat-containing protein [Carboxylicivirga sp. A043]|uniref:InlB B-repeat-containing protein n=1 Tax=Carboxylicivirga litoralis TaxID=2816963 RepID=UPI0021CAF22B|nr:InlB B-repeat-containing protein [Carboxylicivirga sp. A043]MCU4156574.1 InlB B-repeat-containing protein [Carboxylicivirga sp. A043]